MRLGKLDPNSYSQPALVKIKEIYLDWLINFDKRIIEGSATYIFHIIDNNLQSIILDVRNINIFNIILFHSEKEIPIKFSINSFIEDIGEKLVLELPQLSQYEPVIKIRITYETNPIASALKWLTAEQTLGKKHPFLFSQCHAINARSLLPCQDTPSVKFTYKAKITYPKELNALMGAIRLNNENGIAEFEQTIPIPSYLIAIAIGDFVSYQLAENSNVWAEKEILKECAEEFSDTCNYLKHAEDICGKYVWKQYDLLVMPSSFPYGGMENPCLTFVTSSLLAGDKSLATVIAHEIAHSWTGNLVTNANFEHFWLSEGFTVFVEGKIIERLIGSKERDFHSIRKLTILQNNIKDQLAKKPELTKLIVDLSDIGPDDAFSSVPYIKGATFLRYLENLFGGPEHFEPFFKFYLEKFKYKSVLTNDFKSTLNDYFTEKNMTDKLNEIDWNLWLYGEGMPPNLLKLDNSLALLSENLSLMWSNKTVTELFEINMPDISAHQLIYFLDKLIECKIIAELNDKKLQLFEKVFNLKKSKNSQIHFRFLRLCIRARLLNRLHEIFAFANSHFIMSILRPIYRDLAEWIEIKEIVINNFNQVKNQMMTVCSNQIAKDLGLK